MLQQIPLMVDANDLAFIHFKVIIIKKYNFNGVYNFGVQIIFSLTLLVTIYELMMKDILELAETFAPTTAPLETPKSAVHHLSRGPFSGTLHHAVPSLARFQWIRKVIMFP